MSHRSANTTKVFVGSLPAGTTVDELRELFAAYGTIAECNIANRCGFLYLEDMQLALKAIDELNNTNFKGNKICVEKGRIKPAQNRSGGTDRYQRNGFSGGPMRMRDNTNNFRGRGHGHGSPYERRGRGPVARDNYAGGFDRAPLPLAPMGGPDRDRRPFMDDRSRYPYPHNGYGDARMYMYPEDVNNRRTLVESNLMDRRPLMDAQVPPMNDGGFYGNMPSYSYDRRPPTDMYNRRDAPSKPMGGYNSIPRDSSYDLAYSPLQQQQRRYAGGPGSGPGPGPRRDNMPPQRRY